MTSVDIPAINVRYWVFPFYDACADDYVNLRKVNNDTSGKYLVRYDPDSKPGVQLCSELAKQKKMKWDECHSVDRIVNAPTPYGILLPSYAVKSTEGKLEEIHALQNRSSIRPIAKKSHLKHRATPLTIALLNSSISSDPATQIMRLTCRIAPRNPPRNISDLGWVTRTLQTAGINFHKGTYELPTGQNLTRAFPASIANMAKAAKQPANVLALGHERVQSASSVPGDYDKNYLMRKPELAEFGFWSLTAYNAEQFLVDNPLNRYALSDRSDLTYADGSPVYGRNDGNRDGDGSFEILVQPTDVEPSKNWTSNMLPIPKGGGDFSLTLRFYAPSKGLRGGEWSYPVVQKRSAVVD